MVGIEGLLGVVVISGDIPGVRVGVALAIGCAVPTGNAVAVADAVVVWVAVADGEPTSFTSA